jgi:hypothetical protein
MFAAHAPAHWMMMLAVHDQVHLGHFELASMCVLEFLQADDDASYRIHQYDSYWNILQLYNALCSPWFLRLIAPTTVFAL